jgi:hypothetical protein
MGTWTRGGLSGQRAKPIADHVNRCADCSEVAHHLAEANRELQPRRQRTVTPWSP